MRVVLALLIVAATAVPAAAGGPQQLVGTDGSGPVRLLDADLQPVPGSPAFPKGTDGTVLSPNGRRVATWSFSPGTITVRDAATGAAQQTLENGPHEAGEDVYWPTRHHVLTVDWNPDIHHPQTPIIIRSYDLKRHTSTLKRLPGHPLQQARNGNGIRLLSGGGPDYTTPHGGFTVYDLGAAGKVKRTTQLTLPAGMDTYATASLEADQVFVSENNETALVGLDGVITPVTLPDGYWTRLGDHFVTDHQRVATLDAATGAVGPVVDLDDGTLTLDGDGLMVGLGRARYDADLNQVVDNPAADAYGSFFSADVANGRLYAFTHDCSADRYDYGMRIADATTGSLLETKLGGGWTVGVLGAGYMRLTSYDDDCD